MSKPRKLTLQETLDEAVRVADEADELEALAAQTEEEAARELEAQGVDVEALKARLEAREKANREKVAERVAPASKAELAAPSPPPGLPPISGGGDTRTDAKKPVGRVLTFARRGLGRFAAGFAVAACIALAIHLASNSGPSGNPVPTASTAGLPQLGSTPQELRQDAFEQCGRTHWVNCLELLNEAAEADPDSERMPDVQSARALAMRGLTEKQDGG
jgi:hypothetical protein